MLLDGAGWHTSQALHLPDHLRLLFLPPYSPELNPQEHLWDELREKNFHNRFFDKSRLRNIFSVKSLGRRHREFEIGHAS